jgi:cholesterol transport system auxiliary component
MTKIRSRYNQIAPKTIAASPYKACRSDVFYLRFRAYFAVFAALALSFTLAACSALPDKPVRPTLYDFGPGAVSAPPGSTESPLPALALDDVTTSGGALDNTALLYRLAYQDAQQLRPYAMARWSSPPAQLVRQRLREHLSLRRPVFNAREGVAINRGQAGSDVKAVLPLRLRLELEEFSHLFTTPDASVGVIRLRATLVEVTPAGEKFIGQRSVVVQRPAPTSDAPGGVRALTAATDAAIEELDQWLQQIAVR